MSKTVGRLMVPVMQQALLADKKLMYSDFVVHTHCFSSPPASVRAHAKISGIPLQTFRRSVVRLIEAGWAQSRTIGAEVVVQAWMPVEVEELVVQKLTWMRDHVAFMGEWLMRSLLDLVIWDQEYYDNVRPEWLVMGDGSGRLELDRWYPNAHIAFEFQGEQHQRTTSFAPTESELERQIRRDNAKASLCSRQGVRLISLEASDLNLKFIQERVDGRLYRPPIRETRPLFRYIDNLCRSYMNYAKRRVPASTP